MPSKNAQFLSARYQLTENMHTGQQLMPNFICHFCSFLAAFIYLMTVYLGLIKDLGKYALITQVFLFIQSVHCFILPMLMIIFHPLLHRKACLAFQKFKYFFCGSSVVPIDEVGSVPLQNLKAEKNAQTEAYFKQLQETWN
ncbi:hypothetical protein niasHT_037456 [Heterodera trifolii]|uniref:Uncharacterized protein n=1 Tax=Heterodera trifolii TaxID=157864 RepID=A0ABD2I5V0_9BILA